MGSCYDTAYGTEAFVVVGPTSNRRRRDFDDLVEAEARKLEDAARIVDLFVSKTNFWNERIYNELVLSRTEVREVRKELEAARKEVREVLKEVKSARNETSEATTALGEYVANKTSSCDFYFEDYAFHDLYLLYRNVRYNETNLGDIGTSKWVYKQRGGGAVWGLMYSLLTIFLKFGDDRLGSWFAKAHGLTVGPCRKVRNKSLATYHNKFKSRRAPRRETEREREKESN